MDIDTSHRGGFYRFRQDGAKGRIYKCDAKGHATQTGTRWAMEIEGIPGNEVFNTKAEAEIAADAATRAGFTGLGRDNVIEVKALAVNYAPLEDGYATLSVKTPDGKLYRIDLGKLHRARLLNSLADDFASDVIYGEEY